MDQTKFTTHSQELDFLKKMGFTINPLNGEANNLNQIWDIAKDLELKKEVLNYPIDGLVVKLNDLELLDNLGVVGKTNRGWSAIKFSAEEVTTSLVGITWQVGRTGKITPVADLEPVELGGSVVKRATLHNFKEFIESNLVLEDTLVVRKAGEIIPEVVTVLVKLRKFENQKFIAPINCPSCGTELTKTDTEIDLICNNKDACPAQILGRLNYYTSRNLGNIPGLSDKILEKLVLQFKVLDIPDLYDLPLDKIQELAGFGQKSTLNIEQAVEKSRKIKAYKFLAALGVDGIGPEVAKLIVKAIK
jgi:DNA ligase (NAD+)